MWTMCDLGCSNNLSGVTWFAFRFPSRHYEQIQICNLQIYKSLLICAFSLVPCLMRRSDEHRGWYIIDVHRQHPIATSNYRLSHILNLNLFAFIYRLLWAFLSFYWLLSSGKRWLCAVFNDSRWANRLHPTDCKAYRRKSQFYIVNCVNCKIAYLKLSIKLSSRKFLLKTQMDEQFRRRELTSRWIRESISRKYFERIFSRENIYRDFSECNELTREALSSAEFTLRKLLRDAILRTVENDWGTHSSHSLCQELKLQNIVERRPVLSHNYVILIIINMYQNAAEFSPSNRKREPNLQPIWNCWKVFYWNEQSLENFNLNLIVRYDNFQIDDLIWRIHFCFFLCQSDFDSMNICFPRGKFFGKVAFSDLNL